MGLGCYCPCSVCHYCAPTTGTGTEVNLDGCIDPFTVVVPCCAGSGPLHTGTGTDFTPFCLPCKICLEIVSDTCVGDCVLANPPLELLFDRCFYLPESDEDVHQWTNTPGDTAHILCDSYSKWSIQKIYFQCRYSRASGDVRWFVSSPDQTYCSDDDTGIISGELFDIGWVIRSEQCDPLLIQARAALLPGIIAGADSCAACFVEVTFGLCEPEYVLCGCGECNTLGSTQPLPSSMSGTFSGFGDGSASCSQFNGSHTLSYNFSSGYTCHWSKVLPSGALIEVYNDGSLTRLRFVTGSTTILYDLTTPPLLCGVSEVNTFGYTSTTGPSCGSQPASVELTNSSTRTQCCCPGRVLPNTLYLTISSLECDRLNIGTVTLTWGTFFGTEAWIGITTVGAPRGVTVFVFKCRYEAFWHLAYYCMPDGIDGGIDGSGQGYIFAPPGWDCTPLLVSSTLHPDFGSSSECCTEYTANWTVTE